MAYKRAIFIVIILLMATISTSGCIHSSPNTSNGQSELSDDQIVALYERIVDKGRVIEGVCDRPMPSLYPPEPFDKYFVVKGLHCNVNNSLKIYYGTDNVQDWPTGIDTRTNRRGIYGYPYTLDSGPTILGVDRNGTVHMLYYNKSVYLKVGEGLESPILSNGTRAIDWFGSPFKVGYNVTASITNIGVFNKTDIKN